jgi:hypothetical protein
LPPLSKLVQARQAEQDMKGALGVMLRLWRYVALRGICCRGRAMARLLNSAIWQTVGYAMLNTVGARFGCNFSIDFGIFGITRRIVIGVG